MHRIAARLDTRSRRAPRSAPILAFVFVFAVLAAALPVFGGEAAPAAAPASIDELAARFERRVVAITLERVEDIEPPRLDTRRLRGLGEEDRNDVQEYFQRVPGPVTGLLVDDKGHVLTTAYNVAKRVEKVRVILADGRELPAGVIARSPADDLALVRIEGGLPVGYLPAAAAGIDWADASEQRVGQFLVSLGRAPDPARLTATLGIVSATARNFDRLFQTDAALNAGNVGGPLVDLDGRVLGVSAFVGHVYPLWGFNSGIGFGVRADRIREVLPILLEGRDVPEPEQPFVGVGAEGDPEDASVDGARIGNVVEGSAAAEGGVRAGDIIIEYDGVTVQDFVHLRGLIHRKKPGAKVPLKVRRGDEIVALEIVLKTRPSQE